MEVMLEPNLSQSNFNPKLNSIFYLLKLLNNIISALICGCKRNDEGSGPYCDGSHSSKDLEW